MTTRFVLLASKLILFGCFVFTANAQNMLSIENRPLHLVAGAKLQPLLLNQGFGATTTYDLQLGLKNYLLFPSARMGFFEQEVNLKTVYEHTYTIDGFYWQPGITVYSRTPAQHRSAFFMGIFGYFGKFNHNLSVSISDPNWGTSYQYKESFTTRPVGVTLEIGGMLTVVNRLKASFSVNTGFVGLQPIGKIANPNRLPALGLFGNDGIDRKSVV